MRTAEERSFVCLASGQSGRVSRTHLMRVGVVVVVVVGIPGRCGGVWLPMMVAGFGRGGAPRSNYRRK